MPSYDSIAFDPPAPVARVLVRNPVTGEAKSGVPMLLDTGADVTVADVRCQGTSSAIAAHAEMVFPDRRFRGQFLLIDQDLGIIGGNILNSVSLLSTARTSSWDREAR